MHQSVSSRLRAGLGFLKKLADYIVRRGVIRLHLLSGPVLSRSSGLAGHVWVENDKQEWIVGEGKK